MKGLFSAQNSFFILFEKYCQKYKISGILLLKSVITAFALHSEPSESSKNTKLVLFHLLKDIILRLSIFINI
jgi:hypothetical protein